MVFTLKMNLKNLWCGATLSARGCRPSGSDDADLSPMRTCRNDGASPRTRWCSAVCPWADDSCRRCSPASSAGASGRVGSEGRCGVQVVHEVKLLAPSECLAATTPKAQTSEAGGTKLMKVRHPKKKYHTSTPRRSPRFCGNSVVEELGADHKRSRMLDPAEESTWAAADNAASTVRTDSAN